MNLENFYFKSWRWQSKKSVKYLSDICHNFEITWQVVGLFIDGRKRKEVGVTYLTNPMVNKKHCLNKTLKLQPREPTDEYVLP